MDTLWFLDLKASHPILKLFLLLYDLQSKNAEYSNPKISMVKYQISGALLCLLTEYSIDLFVVKKVAKTKSNINVVLH